MNEYQHHGPCILNARFSNTESEHRIHAANGSDPQGLTVANNSPPAAKINVVSIAIPGQRGCLSPPFRESENW